MDHLPLRTRAKPIYGILFTSIISVMLISMRGWKSLGAFRQFIQDNRSISSAVVQLISSALGMAQLYTATTLINVGTRVYLTAASIPLGKLKFWTVLLARQIDFALPWKKVFITALFFVIAQAPAALWAGALTPVFMASTEPAGSLQIPTFTSTTENIWNNQFQLRGPEVWNNETNCTTSRNEQGFAASCPVPDMQGLLLNSATSASTLTGGPRNHSKNDNTQWTYRGRSFGVGSSQGVLSPAGLPLASQLQTYQYTEGYMSSVSCDQNTSSAYGNFPFEYAFENRVLVWAIAGYLPNSVPGNSESYPVFTWSTEGEEFLAWSAVVNEGKNMIAITTTEKFKSFNQTQCVVTFLPTNFNVVVDLSTQVIVVTPSNSSGTARDIEPTGHLTANTMYSINLLSRMSTSLYVSVLGESLNYNVETLTGQDGNTTISSEIINTVVESCFEAVIDDILVAFGIAQLILANSSTSVPVNGVYTAVRIGQDTFIYATLGINILLALIALIEAVRTRLWHRLPTFDYTNVVSVVIAASAGYGLVANEARHREGRMHDLGNSKRESTKAVDGIVVQLKSQGGDGTESGQIAIVTAMDQAPRPRPRHYKRYSGEDMMEMNLLHHRTSEISKYASVYTTY